jgi:microcystin-dependent protein
LITGGKYINYGANAPGGYTTLKFSVEVIGRDTDFIVQTATCLEPSYRDITWRRTKNATWGTWYKTSTTTSTVSALDADTLASTTPGTRGLTALSQVTTLDADTVGTLAATTLAPIGSISLFGGPTSPPTGWLSCDGSSLSRTAYPSLFGVLIKSMGTFTVTLATPGVFTLTAHGLTSGDGVYFTTTGSLPTGLSSNTIYFVTVVTVDTFKVSTTYANYVAGTFVNTSVSQSGTHTSFRSPWGVPAGGTTNFYLPDLRLTAQGIPNATAAVGGWTAYTPTISNLGSGVANVSTCRWRRVGDEMEIEFYASKDATSGTGVGIITVSYPTGYSALAVNIMYPAMFCYSAGNGWQAYAINCGTTSFTFIGGETEQNFRGQDWGANQPLGFRASVPIAQWTTNNNLVTYVIKY